MTRALHAASADHTCTVAKQTTLHKDMALACSPYNSLPELAEALKAIGSHAKWHLRSRGERKRQPAYPHLNCTSPAAVLNQVPKAFVHHSYNALTRRLLFYKELQVHSLPGNLKAFRQQGLRAAGKDEQGLSVGELDYDLFRASTRVPSHHGLSTTVSAVSVVGC